MYTVLYESFISCYLRFYDLRGARVATIWNLAALAFMNSFAIVVVLANAGISWGEIAFRILKRKEVAIAFALAWLLWHYFLSARYERRSDTVPSGVRKSRVPIWIGSVYAFGTAVFCISVINSLD